MNREIEDVIKRRSEKNRNLFFIEPTVIDVFDEYSLIKRKNRVGIRHNGNEVFQPIFDAVHFLDGSVCALRINNLWAIANIVAGEVITDFCYADIKHNLDGLFTVSNIEGKKGLYDLSRRIEVIPPLYDEIGTVVGVKYIWVRNGRFYGFVERGTYRFIQPGGIVYAYDSPEQMIGINSDGRVVILNSDGYESTDLLRHSVLKAGGYLSLYNFAHRHQDIIDVYGNIVNA